MIEVEVAFCGICGSDVGEFRDGPVMIRSSDHPLSRQGAPPIVLGHEFSGRVSAVGAGVTELAVGDRVAANASWRCGRCRDCLSGDYNRCSSGGAIGLISDGALASHVRFPSYCAVPLPDAVSYEEGALIEPLAVALHALERGNARPGDQVVILGFGPIGAACAEIARAGALQVTVLEPHAGRRSHASSMGFDTLQPDEGPRSTQRAVRRLTGGGADIVVDCTGSPAVLGSAPELLRRGGVVVLVGLPHGPASIDAGRLVLTERSIIAALAYRDEPARVATMIANGTVRAGRLITTIIDLKETVEHFARLADDPGDDIKVLVRVTPLLVERYEDE
ncbi:alcohol dehydrogenase catalytic domain-containing protein [Nocardioides sp.]|uniref:alcohol dehydrogenase catalytic domain-containing protein n=1 Tax=Nocardioides sp. TaxID=35761 RepID=UPI00260360B4|nr:alcohol dehydrogenase catalytic domain-containing protein [Nocardioides sp.]